MYTNKEGLVSIYMASSKIYKSASINLLKLKLEKIVNSKLRYCTNTDKYPLNNGRQKTRAERRRLWGIIPTP